MAMVSKHADNTNETTGYEIFIMMEKAAVIIQKNWRGHSTRKNIAIQGEAAIVIQSHYRGYVVRREISNAHEAVTVIQAGWRGYQDRRDLTIQDKAAVVIQSYYRGYLTRVELYIEQQAACTIQSHYKGYKAREAFQQQKTAAITIQAHYRGYSARKALSAQNDAATSIQAHNGCQTRRPLTRNSGNVADTRVLPNYKPQQVPYRSTVYGDSARSTTSEISKYAGPEWVLSNQNRTDRQFRITRTRKTRTSEVKVLEGIGKGPVDELYPEVLLTETVSKSIKDTSYLLKDRTSVGPRTVSSAGIPNYRSSDDKAISAEGDGIEERLKEEIQSSLSQSDELKNVAFSTTTYCAPEAVTHTIKYGSTEDKESAAIADESVLYIEPGAKLSLSQTGEKILNAPISDEPDGIPRKKTLKRAKEEHNAICTIQAGWKGCQVRKDIQEHKAAEAAKLQEMQECESCKVTNMKTSIPCKVVTTLAYSSKTEKRRQTPSQGIEITEVEARLSSPRYYQGPRVHLVFKSDNQVASKCQNANTKSQVQVNCSKTSAQSLSPQKPGFRDSQKISPANSEYQGRSYYNTLANSKIKLSRSSYSLDKCKPKFERFISSSADYRAQRSKTQVSKNASLSQPNEVTSAANEFLESAGFSRVDDADTINRVFKTRKRIQEENEASSTIQAAWKGYLTRQEIKKQMEAATKIQATFRGFKERGYLSGIGVIGENKEEEVGVIVLCRKPKSANEDYSISSNRTQHGANNVVTVTGN